MTVFIGLKILKSTKSTDAFRNVNERIEYDIQIVIKNILLFSEKMWMVKKEINIGIDIWWSVESIHDFDKIKTNFAISEKTGKI